METELTFVEHADKHVTITDGIWNTYYIPEEYVELNGINELVSGDKIAINLDDQYIYDNGIVE